MTTTSEDSSLAAEGRIRKADLRYKTPRWEMIVGPWQTGDRHGWRVNGFCRRCKASSFNCPGPTLLLAVIAFRDSSRTHRKFCDQWSARTSKGYPA